MSIRCVRSNRGQTTVEYVGMILVVAVIVGVMVSPASGIADAMTGQVERAVCVMAGEGDCAVAARAESDGGSPASKPGDLDGDGLSDASETARGSNPNAADVDGDGLTDAEEQARGSDPNVADADGDGVEDAEERRRGTDPNEPGTRAPQLKASADARPVNGRPPGEETGATDSDGDGLSDAVEAASSGATESDPRREDSDRDGLTDAQELAIGTLPSEPDSDGEHGASGDGIPDGREVLEHESDPLTYDSDADGNPDGLEVTQGDDPTTDDRNALQKLGNLILDDPFTLGKGAILKAGARKALGGLLARGGSKAGALAGARSFKEAAAIRREKVRAALAGAKQRAKETAGRAKRRLADERGSVGGGGRNFPRPPAKNPALDRAVNQLFRAEDRFPGGTAEAIRRGQGHIQKGRDRIRELNGILRRERLGAADRATAERVRNDLIDALKSQGR